MLNQRIKAALVVLAASAGLSACTSFGNPYGGSGIGVTLGSSPYGYGSQYGYGSPYGYGYGYGGPYGYTSPYFGYARYPYFGWYDGFYYPGGGGWVYDPYGGRFPITERQSDYWRNMLAKFRQERGATAEVKPTFSGFRAKARAGATIPGVDLDAVARADQASVRQINQARRRAQVEQRQQVRAERAQARAERSQVRVERQETLRQQVSERREARRARRAGGE